MDNKFTNAYRHLVQLSAIMRITDYKESVRELIMQTITVSGDQKLKSEDSIIEAIDAYFGIEIDSMTVGEELRHLLTSYKVSMNMFNEYVLATEEEKLRTSLIEESRANEEEVFSGWHEELPSDLENTLDFNTLKECLKLYMAKVFRSHGLEAAKLLDDNDNLEHSDFQSISQSLQTSIRKFFDDESHAPARIAISMFFNNANLYPGRRKYLIDLADGAFTFFIFHTAPEVKSLLKDSLRKIQFYLDTNFLWGILELHDNQYVEASRELLKVSRSLHLPFSYHYHETTEQELIKSISSASNQLLKRKWASKISKQIWNNGYISGVEQLFHKQNAVRATDVESFLKPYQNVSLLLEEKKIIIDNSSPEWDDETQEIYSAYKTYIEKHDINRSEDAIHHDAKLLALARKMRSNNKSPLLAGSLILTCDSHLYHFDVQDSRRRHKQPASILPGILLQILRPVISDSEDFDKLFINTFSIPEFRSYSRSSSKAVHMMAEIFSSYDNLSQDMAQQMLMDDILIAKVGKSEDEKEIKGVLDEAIIKRLKRETERREQAEKEKTELHKETHGLSSQIDSLSQEVEKANTEKENIVSEKHELTNQLSGLASDKSSLSSSITKRDNVITGLGFLISLILSIILFFQLPKLFDEIKIPITTPEQWMLTMGFFFFCITITFLLQKRFTPAYTFFGLSVASILSYFANVAWT